MARPDLSCDLYENYIRGLGACLEVGSLYGDLISFIVSFSGDKYTSTESDNNFALMILTKLIQAYIRNNKI